jgi:hypothetical protein
MTISSEMKLKTIKQRDEVIFDPEIPEHRDAYLSLRLEGKQSKEYRFVLEHPFINIPAMMEYKLSLYACNTAQSATA